MAFQELQKGHDRKKLVGTASVRKAGSTCFITVSSDIYKKLGEPSFAKFHLGTGEHEGLLLLSPTKARAKNVYTFSPKTRTIPISAAAIGLSGSGNLRTTRLSNQVTEDGLIIDFTSLASKPAEFLEAAE